MMKIYIVSISDDDTSFVVGAFQNEEVAIDKVEELNSKLSGKGEVAYLEKVNLI